MRFFKKLYRRNALKNKSFHIYYKLHLNLCAYEGRLGNQNEN
jgi:hypothetical protein